MKSSEIYYSVGALLYSPANNAKIAEEIASERFGRKYSIALCLEDTIKDDRVESFRAGAQGEGDAGVTIVKFR